LDFFRRDPSAGGACACSFARDDRARSAANTTKNIPDASPVFVTRETRVARTRSLRPG